MEIINDITDIELSNTAVTIGNFDGVHVGHQKLIEYMNNIAFKKNLRKVIFTFKHHTSRILNPGKDYCFLMNYDEKIDVLKSFNPDYIMALDFTEDFSRMSYVDFIENILLKKLGCKVLVVGEDFKMGYNGLGNTARLAEICNIHDIILKVIPHSRLYGNTISSTYIRKLIAEGQVDVILDYLGRYYGINGTVIHGKQLGRTIGFPTINLSYEGNLCLPKNGVYVTYTLVSGKWYLSITNIGIRPTFKNDNKVSIESHLIGFDGELYGETVRTAFVKHIRDEKRFADIRELRQQLIRDVEYALNYNKLFYNCHALW